MLALAKNIQETGQEYDFHIGGYSGVDFFFLIMAFYLVMNHLENYSETC